ncbi:ATP-grasp domain-containing protein [Streptomyces sp. TLI_105]|uniref:ATP-grasp domain-containing protein n=1 Tax=Streptomyces sp. TLI_105 TaxID=1881019 RepID=UPI00089A8FCE|nr:ATP-grasp domain-containing protein [Streptomyces sp. TLI_105]SEC15366.1 Biotin carboxylase [Streptomyces sp. TLI_105]
MSVLILHTSNASRKRHFARARLHGERLLLIVKNPTWEPEFVDRVVAADTSSIEDTVAAARELAASETEKIDAVVAFVEHSVPAAAAVAAALGVPFISEKTAHIARNKFEMRTEFARHGDVPGPGFGLAHTLDEARKLAADIGYPLVMKPLIGGGSMYVRRVDGETELDEHFELIRSGSWDGFDYDPLYRADREKYGAALLLEGYIQGDEISVESIVRDGVTHVVAIHDKPLPMEGPFFEEVFYCTPTRLAPELQARIRELTANAHDALDIHTGATHTEFRITADGEPVILETAARLGGGPIYRSVLTSTGVDMVDAVLDVSLGRTPNLAVPGPVRPTGFFMFFAERAGVITSIGGVEEVRAAEGVVEVELYKNVGDAVQVPPHIWQAHGHVVFTVDDPADLDARFAELRDMLRIDVAPQQ